MASSSALVRRETLFRSGLRTVVLRLKLARRFARSCSSRTALRWNTSLILIKMAKASISSLHPPRTSTLPNTRGFTLGPSTLSSMRDFDIGHHNARIHSSRRNPTFRTKATLCFGMRIVFGSTSHGNRSFKHEYCTLRLFTRWLIPIGTTAKPKCRPLRLLPLDTMLRIHNRLSSYTIVMNSEWRCQTIEFIHVGAQPIKTRKCTRIENCELPSSALSLFLQPKEG